jgi:hypothetical protein
VTAGELALVLALAFLTGCVQEVAKWAMGAVKPYVIA